MKLNALACFTFVILFASFAAAQQSPSLLSAVSSGAGSNIDWPQFNFDSAHDGYNPYETILSPANVANVELKWSYATAGNEVQGPPVVANGKVYFGVGNEGPPYSLYALDAATGQFLWKFPNGLGIYSPAVANGLVYTISDYDVNLYALDANTGAIVWQFQDSTCWYSPTVVNNVVYIYSFSPFVPGITALNAQTGAVIWHHDTGTESWVNSSPTVANGVVYYNSGSGTVDALSADTGALLWERQLGASLATPYAFGGNDAGQTVANGVLYVEVRHTLYALNANTGAIIWFKTLDRLSILAGTPAAANGLVYVTTGSRVLAFNATTGSPVWQYDDGDFRLGKYPLVANGVVYVSSWQGLGGRGNYKILALDASTGTLLWNHKTEGDGDYSRVPTPVVVNGMIYGSINTPVDAFGAFGLPNQ